MFGLYTNNKRSYMAFRESNKTCPCDDAFSLMIGGKKSSEKKSMKLQTPRSIQEIGEFMIQDAVIGDCEWKRINLIPGIYKAYRVDDNLMIIHKDLKEKPTKKDIVEWVWEYTGKWVNVESGSFGFFNLPGVKKILKEMKSLSRGKKKKSKKNEMPRYDISFPDDKLGFGLLVKNTYYIPSNVENNVHFGVVASTMIGDGGFQCFTIGNDKAILVGGLTGEAIGVYPST
jgi:hypothetical protein